MNTTKIAAALALIGQGFAQLAEAIEAEPLTSAHTGDSVDDQPDDLPFDKDPESPKEIELADLQELGAQIIKLGRKTALLEIFADMGVKNLSAIPVSDQPEAYARMLKLTKAA